MTNSDFGDDSPFHGYVASYDYDDTPAAKPSRWVVLGTLIIVLLGGIWSVAGFLQVAGFIGGFEAPIWWGIATYTMTLLAPSACVIYLRRFHFRYSMPTDDGEFANYDSHATQQAALQARKVALLGVFFSLFAIFIVVWPIAQRFA